MAVSSIQVSLFLKSQQSSEGFKSRKGKIQRKLQEGRGMTFWKFTKRDKVCSEFKSQTWTLWGNSPQRWKNQIAEEKTTSSSSGNSSVNVSGGNLTMTAKSSAKRYSLSGFKLYFTLDHLQYGHRVFINIDHRTRELNFVFRNHGNLSPIRNFGLKHQHSQLARRWRWRWTASQGERRAALRCAFSQASGPPWYHRLGEHPKMIYSHSVTFDYCIPPSGPWMSGRCSWTMWTGRRSLASCSDSVLTPGTRTSSSYSSGLVNLFVPAVKYNDSLFFSPQGTGDVLEEIEDEERSKVSIVEIHKDSWNMNSCIFPLFCNRFHYHGCWNWID